MSAPNSQREPGTVQKAAQGRRRARDGARPAIDRVCDEHIFDVYAFIACHGLSRQDAEDLTQATFERAVRAWPRYDPTRASAKTWLLAIARNVLIDHHRRRRTHPIVLADTDSSMEPAPSEVVGAQAQPGLPDQLEDALRSLSAREQEVIALRFAGDLDCADIATMLRISHANVQQISSRALRKLRGHLQDPAEQSPS